MKQRWQGWMQKLDVLSVRERLFVFVSLLVCAVALVDTFWLVSARATHAQLQLRMMQQGLELKQLRDVVRSGPRPDDANRVVRDELTQTRARMDALDQHVAKLLPQSDRSAPLEQVLVHLLKRQPGLTLVRTVAVPPEAAGPGNDNGAAQLPAGLTRQGVALTVAGSYADLTRYLATLESALPQVRWGALSLAVPGGEPELTLQLFLISRRQP